ncbi:hypothetical protein V2J09_002892 [Rumex salicifolius]
MKRCCSVRVEVTKNALLLNRFNCVTSTGFSFLLLSDLSSPSTAKMALLRNFVEASEVDLFCGHLSSILSAQILINSALCYWEMEFSFQLQNLSYFKAKQIVSLMGLIVIIHLSLQSLVLPYGNALRSLMLNGKDDIDLKFVGAERDVTNSVVLDDKDPNEQAFERDKNVKVVSDNVTMDSGISGGVPLREETKSLNLEKSLPNNNDSSGNQTELMGNGNHETNSDSQATALGLGHEDLLTEDISLHDSESKRGSLHGEEAENKVKEPETVSSEDEIELSHDTLDTERKTSTAMHNDTPPNSVITVGRMNQILAGYLKSPLSMKPQWASSQRDMEILDAKSKIMNAPVSQNTGDLYSPLFNNISMFMRSYELMERTLKVYVYRDGGKPIFHQPVLKGLYASEGWFMKLMEGNRHYTVKDPRKAHLFYMPFSSRELEHNLYIPNSNNLTNILQFMKQYSNKMSSKYPYWNRTGGMDHFLVACHDWALYETKHMDNSIRALCNADISIGFKLGRDVSLPETFIRYARNPLRNVGGNPPSERSILAFYSGNNHGYLRPLLLKRFQNRHPDMRIYELMPRGVAKRMNYIKHMKSSKYCLCPRGFEVNSPRIIESIFYECVPVIISDNFVPPFLEVLNWDAFSVLVPEKDVPRLREILVAIPEERYLKMQLAVRKVQRHFLWNLRPLKYDLFHMTLHSIWLSRVFQLNS